MEKIASMIKEYIDHEGISHTYNATSKGYDYDILFVERERYNSRIKEAGVGYDCPICNNRQFTMILEGEYNVVVPCECQTIYTTDLNMTRSGLLQIFKTYSLDTFKEKNAVSRNMKAVALEYLKDDSTKWFFVGGQVGSGKTHIATAILQELMKRGTPALYKRWHEITKELKADMNSKEHNLTLHELKTTKLLYIDDFLKNATDADYGYAFEIIQGRADRKLKTMLSSELLISDIELKDEAVSSRIEAECGKYCIQIGQDKKANYRAEQIEF